MEKKTVIKILLAVAAAAGVAFGMYKLFIESHDDYDEDDYDEDDYDEDDYDEDLDEDLDEDEDSYDWSKADKKEKKEDICKA